MNGCLPSNVMMTVNCDGKPVVALILCPGILFPPKSGGRQEEEDNGGPSWLLRPGEMFLFTSSFFSGYSDLAVKKTARDTLLKMTDVIDKGVTGGSCSRQRRFLPFPPPPLESENQRSKCHLLALLFFHPFLSGGPSAALALPATRQVAPVLYPRRVSNFRRRNFAPTTVGKSNLIISTY